MNIGGQHLLVVLVVFQALWYSALLVFSIAYPAHRIWPTPASSGRGARFRSWMTRTTGLAFGLSALALIGLSWIDFGSLGLPPALALSTGAILFGFGGAFALAGFRTLGPDVSTGVIGELEVSGPYAFSRNPQYVGTVGVLVGFILLSNSSLVAIGALAWIPWYVMAPFAEEAWLRELLGSPYESYLTRTRRYL